MAVHTVVCQDNLSLASFLHARKEEFSQRDGYAGKMDTIFNQAYKNVCLCKDPIDSLKEARKVKGIGNYLLTILKEEFFDSVEEIIDQTAVGAVGKRATKVARKYLPQKNSAPYAILITLYRITVQEEKEFTFKQELIEAADASGLSTKPIEPGRGSGASGRFGDSTNDWYSGWSSMKTLISKGLVVKSNRPARYKLTQEGRKTAEECMERSGLDTGLGMSQPLSSQPTSVRAEPMDAAHSQSLAMNKGSRRICDIGGGFGDPHASPPSCVGVENMDAGSPEQSQVAGESKDQEEFSKLKHMGFRDADIAKALTDARDISISGTRLWETALDILLEEKAEEAGNDVHATPLPTHSSPAREADQTFRPSKPCGFTQAPPPNFRAANISTDNDHGANALVTPPLGVGETFENCYDVILLLDDREHYARDSKGVSSALKFAERLMSQYKAEVEVRHLPVGDATWIGRHKCTKKEYMLNFIVERKRVDDLLSSIRDSRYKTQKFRLKRCGVKRLIYLIEGDPNLTDSTETLKTAALTTEISDGFYVQRTKDTHETIKWYGELTAAIMDRYRLEGNTGMVGGEDCLTYCAFLDHCKDLEKERVSDIFAVQLTQVKLVTEDVALSVLDRYPTLAALIQGYAALEGDQSAQEDMLKGLPIRNKNKTVSSGISKNIYKFVWAT